MYAIRWTILSRYGWIWPVCFAIAVCHIFALPLLATFDSHGYLHLAQILGTSRFPAEWDFLRTPLFPALLKLTFLVFGADALALFFLQAVLGCAGIWLLSRRARGPRLAAGVLLLAAFPTLIAYEHAFLSEPGTFFFFALLITMLASPRAPSFPGAAWLAAAIGAGFYYRSSLLYLAPLIAAIYVMSAVRPSPRRSLPQFLIVAAVPFLIAYPWQRNPQTAARTGRNVILYGLVKQAVLPLTDPVLGDAANLYSSAVEASKTNGSLPNSGLTGGRHTAVIRAIGQNGPEALAIFARSVAGNPSGYLAGVGRNLLLYATLVQDPTDPVYNNDRVREIVFSSTASQIDPGPPELGSLGEGFSRRVRPNPVSLAMRALAPIYEWLVRLGLLATLAGLFMGIRRWDRGIVAYTALPLAFILMHALLLLSGDRMIMPAQPVLLWNLVMLPAWLGRGT
jgi:hypothetical protein